MTDFILQLHITGNCKLRCKHCYIDEHCHNMSLADIKKVVSQYEELVSKLEGQCGHKIRAHINFTGGEPLLHPEINEILKFFISVRKRFLFAVMSNGTVLRFSTLRLLKKLRLKNFQVSLDGDEETHDSIRCKGNFKKVLRALDIMRLWKIPTRVSFTANKDNYRLFPKVAKACRRHRAQTLWSDRYIPFSDNPEIKPLTADDMKDYADILKSERDNPANRRRGLYVQNYRALQFACSSGCDDIIYYCKAGDSMLTVDECGDIMPCRRMPIFCGNINSTSLLDVYENNEAMKRLREYNLYDKCISCQYAQKCKGGERCFTYAITGDYEKPDPCCWLN